MTWVPIRLLAAAAVLYGLSTAPATAQQSAAASQDELLSPAPPPPTPAAQVAESSAGRTGQRQTREEAPANIEPMGRINDRIANRVQNRIRNRIDRYYDPLGNAASPFEDAVNEARRAAGRPRR